MCSGLHNRFQAESTKEFKSINSKNRLNNYSEGRVSFDTNQKDNISRKYQHKSKPQKFHPRDHSQGALMEDLMEENSVSNAGSFSKINKMNQYYHNAKALENVLKEDKEALLKLEKEKQKIMERKQKVASYSKLVKEIHWEGKNEKREKFDYLPKKKSKGTGGTNKTFEENRSSKMMALEKIKDYRKKNTEKLKSAQEQGELSEPYNDVKSLGSRNSKIQHNKSQTKAMQGLSNVEHNFEPIYPKSSK